MQVYSLMHIFTNNKNLYKVSKLTLIKTKNTKYCFKNYVKKMAILIFFFYKKLKLNFKFCLK